MSIEGNRAIVRRVVDAFNRGNLAVIDETYAPTYVHHDPAHPWVRSHQDYKRWLTGLRTIFPDLHCTIEDLIAEGDGVVCRYTLRGTHQGQRRGMPATGKQVVVSGITIISIVDGKAVEAWLNSYQLAF